MEPVTSQKVSRKPRCARCRNHGLVVALKGHAGRCRFSECGCGKCALITERRRIMARQRGMKKSQRAEKPGDRAGASSGVNSPPVYGVRESPTRAADTEDKTYTELEAPGPAASGAWAPDTGVPPNSSNHSRGTQDTTALSAQPHPPWEYFMTDIPPEIPPPATAMPFHLHAHNASTYAHPGFLLGFGTPPYRVVGFPHVPQTTLISQSREENPGFFFMPYLLHQEPDHFLQTIRERADASPRQHGRDSGESADSRRRGSTPAEGAFP